MDMFYQMNQDLGPRNPEENPDFAGPGGFEQGPSAVGQTNNEPEGEAIEVDTDAKEAKQNMVL